MSFGTFFTLFWASKPFDVKAYKRYVKAGQALALEIDRQIASQSSQPIPDDVRRSIMQAQLIAAIDDPVNVLRHLARYLAMNRDFWAAGKLHGTYTMEAQRRNRHRNDRRKGARTVNVERKSVKTAWVEAAIRAGRRLRAKPEHARKSDSELAKLIVKSHEFSSLKTRRPSWNTVRAELSILKLSRAARRRKRT